LQVRFDLRPFAQNRKGRASAYQGGDRHQADAGGKADDNRQRDEPLTFRHLGRNPVDPHIGLFGKSVLQVLEAVHVGSSFREDGVDGEVGWAAAPPQGEESGAAPGAAAA
jgi:hypothetical protein